MNSKFYARFLASKVLGRKEDAKEWLDKFIASFESLEEKRVWVLPFLEARNYGHRIRHEIYEHLVYPVLLDGYLRHETRSVIWLARTTSNLFGVKGVHPDLQNKGELDFFREAYMLEPNEEIRVYLLKHLLGGFHYLEHEWPVGILYGFDWADVEQCEKILRDIAFATTIDVQNRHTVFLQEFEERVRHYKAHSRE